MNDFSDQYAIYFPAVNDGYASTIAEPLPPDRRFPSGLSLSDLIFWEPNALWNYPYLLHSIGLHSVGTNPDNAVTQRVRENNTLLGDSGGFQIGSGTLKGLKSLPPKAMPAADAVHAWKEAFEVKRWIVGWLETHADYAMTLDMPLWATAKGNENSPFHRCSTQQLIDMTVSNLKFIESRSEGRTKWLNVVQGGKDTAQIKTWWDAVKWFRHGGWAMAGSAGHRGGLYHMLSTMLMMRDENAFDSGQDWVHVLGISTPKWAILLSSIQQALQKNNPALRVSYDSSSPFQDGGIREQVALTPAFTNDARTWGIGKVRATQSRQLAYPSSTIPFEHSQSPLGQRMLLNHLNVRGGLMDHRQFDSISNMLLTHHNVWVYVDAMKTANDLAFARDVSRVPKLYLEAMDCIADVFQRGAWSACLAENRALLDAVAPFQY